MAYREEETEVKGWFKTARQITRRLRINLGFINIERVSTKIEVSRTPERVIAWALMAILAGTVVCAAISSAVPEK